MLDWKLELNFNHCSLSHLHARNPSLSITRILRASCDHFNAPKSRQISWLYLRSWRFHNYKIKLLFVVSEACNTKTHEHFTSGLIVNLFWRRSMCEQQVLTCTWPVVFNGHSRHHVLHSRFEFSCLKIFAVVIPPHSFLFLSTIEEVTFKHVFGIVLRLKDVQIWWQTLTAP